MITNNTKMSIEMRKSMSESLYATLTAYYLPVIGHSAYLFYISLVAIKKAGFVVHNHRLLQKMSGMSFEGMEKARKTCEQFQLVRTFYKKEEDTYLYILSAPMNAADFLSHEVYGRLFVHTMGEEAFAFYKAHLTQEKKSKKGFEEVSSTMQDTLKNHWTMSAEERFQEIKEQEDSKRNHAMHIIFDESLFLNNLSDLVWPKKERTPKNIRAVAEVATIYGISEQMMRTLIGRGVDPATKTFDITRLKAACVRTKAKYVMDHKDPFKLPPRRFLEQLQNGASLSRSDIALIEKLLCDYALQPEVVNVLLETCIKKDKNGAVVATRVERLAGGWLRLNVDTIEKARAQQIIEMQSKAVLGKQSIVQEWEFEEEEESMDEEARAKLIAQVKGSGQGHGTN